MPAITKKELFNLNKRIQTNKQIVKKIDIDLTHPDADAFQQTKGYSAANWPNSLKQ